MAGSLKGLRSLLSKCGLDFHLQPPLAIHSFLPQLRSNLLIMQLGRDNSIVYYRRCCYCLYHKLLVAPFLLQYEADPGIAVELQRDATQNGSISLCHMGRVRTLHAAGTVTPLYAYASKCQPGDLSLVPPFGARSISSFQPGLSSKRTRPLPVILLTKTLFFCQNPVITYITR